MPSTDLPPSTAGGPGRRVRALLWVGAATVLLGLALAVWLWPRERGAAPVATAGPAAGPDAPRTPLAAAALPAPPGPTPSRSAEEELSAALHEARVTLASGVVIEGIDTDRPWVCAGEPIRLAARVGGEREPGAAQRWVWRTGEGSAELHPGPAILWRAPEVAGSYTVRFQVCKDLGERRVGVLAERAVEIEVRACGEGEGQEHEPLRIGVVQQGHGRFAFHALATRSPRIATYVWNFGDGLGETTTEPVVEHGYAVSGLGPHEVKSFAVRLEARAAGGERLAASAFVLTRGRPPHHDPPPVDLEISRWRPRADGGWESEIVVRNPSTPASPRAAGQAPGDIRWERLERITLHGDDRAETVVRPWSDLIVVEQQLERGGFRGRVTVSAAEASPDVKQILDFLHGRDATGQEVTVSWSPFKREAPPLPPGAVEPAAPPHE